MHGLLETTLRVKLRLESNPKPHLYLTNGLKPDGPVQEVIWKARIYICMYVYTCIFVCMYICVCEREREKQVITDNK